MADINAYASVGFSLSNAHFMGGSISFYIGTFMRLRSDLPCLVNLTPSDDHSDWNILPQEEHLLISHTLRQGHH